MRSGRTYVPDLSRSSAGYGPPEWAFWMSDDNAVPVMSLIKIVRGLETSDATRDAAAALAEQLGKVPTTVKSAPGVVVNRIRLPIIKARRVQLLRTFCEVLLWRRR